MNNPIYATATSLIGGKVLLRAYTIHSVMVDFVICAPETNIEQMIKDKWNVIFYEVR